MMVGYIEPLKDIEKDLSMELVDCIRDINNIEERIEYLGYSHGKMTFQVVFADDIGTFRYDVFDGTLKEEYESKKGNEYLIEQF